MKSKESVVHFTLPRLIESSVISMASNASSPPPTSASKVLNVNVGVLGHVDSGKTSLVKALSTSLSTAALDKNPQSQLRGITLDLGRLVHVHVCNYSRPFIGCSYFCVF